MFELIKKIFKNNDVRFIISLVGPLVMGTINLVSIIMHFDWIFLNYSIFAYLMALIKVWFWAIDKYKIKPTHYSAGVISLLLILAPMMAALVLTIRYKDEPHYIFDWFIYAYALYGTIKMVFAVKNMTKKDKTISEYVLTYFSMISALYTIQMMEFALIKTFDANTSDNSMYVFTLFHKERFFSFVIVVIFIFVFKTIKENKKRKRTIL